MIMTLPSYRKHLYIYDGQTRTFSSSYEKRNEVLVEEFTELGDRYFFLDRSGE